MALFRGRGKLGSKFKPKVQGSKVLVMQADSETVARVNQVVKEYVNELKDDRSAPFLAESKRTRPLYVTTKESLSTHVQ